MNRAGQLVFASCMFVAIAGLVFWCAGCRPACTVIDWANKACVIIPVMQPDGTVKEIKVPGNVALQYLNSGRIGAERCPK